MEVLLLKRRLFLEEAELHGGENPIVFWNYFFAFVSFFVLDPHKIRHSYSPLPVWSQRNHHLLFLPKTASSSTSRQRRPTRVFLKKLQLFVWRREIIIHGFGSWNWTHLLTFCAAKTPNYPPLLRKIFALTVFLILLIPPLMSQVTRHHLRKRNYF